MNIYMQTLFSDKNRVHKVNMKLEEVTHDEEV